MSQEQRRAMIVRSVLPLVIEHGMAVTTSQIARAAGIGEATVFRAFKDKEELIHACVAAALSPDDVLDAIAAIPLDQPLADRLVEAAATMEAHLDRMGRLMGALHASGAEPKRDPAHGASAHGRTESMDRTREAVAELFEPERDSLRAQPDQVAAVFLGTLLTRSSLGAGGEPMDVGALVDLFLRGALRE